MGYCKKFGTLNFLDCICCMLASTVVLSYMFRRYQASLHRQIKTGCTLPASFPASSATFTLPREAPLCSEDKVVSRVCIGTSPIPTHGLGLLLSTTTNVLQCGDPIGIALDTNNGTYSKRGIIDHFIPQVTPMASKLNHCAEKSNVRIVREVSTTHLLRSNHAKDHKSQRKTGRWILIATQDVTVGEELTVDYSDLPWYLWQPLPWWTCD